MEQITADYDSGTEQEQEQEEDDRHPAISSASNHSSSTFFLPRTSAATPRSGVTVPAVRGGVKKVFKHIEIQASDDDSADEVDYVPPKNYAEDSDDSSSDESVAPEVGSEDERDKMKEIEKNLPMESSLCRKRKVKKSKETYARAATKVTTNLKSKTPFDRVRVYPDQPLTVVNGKLCCRVCKNQVLALKVSSIKNHIRNDTHKRNMVKEDKTQLTLLSYKQLVVTNESEESAAGATLSLDASAYRMAVCHAFLKSGTPFALLDNGSEIRDLLEDGHAKCPKQACSDMIPLLYKKEYEEIVRELDDVHSFSISSDGTINVAEALAVVRLLHFRNQVPSINLLPTSKCHRLCGSSTIKRPYSKESWH